MNNRFDAFDPLESAALVHHYITHMVDKAQDNLPYWLLLPNKKPAEAAHCRVDDAELVGSWYEGLHSAMQMLSSTICRTFMPRNIRATPSQCRSSSGGTSISSPT